MKKLKSLVLATVALAIISVSACQVITPITATSNEVGSKVGRASGAVWFGAFYKNPLDLSIMAAAKNGNIRRISTVDFSKKWLFIGVRYETIVTGN